MAYKKKIDKQNQNISVLNIKGEKYKKASIWLSIIAIAISIFGMFYLGFLEIIALILSIMSTVLTFKSFRLTKLTRLPFILSVISIGLSSSGLAFYILTILLV